RPPDPPCWVPLIWPSASGRGLGEGEYEAPARVNPSPSASYSLEPHETLDITDP
ncbi:hypothetical protein P7K49_036524, partial [Saguinus oedipus]